VPTSISVLATGAGLGLTGAFVFASAPRQVICGQAGGNCISGKNEGFQRDAGAWMIGAGLGVAATGAIGMASAYDDPLAAGEERADEPMAVAGFAITSLGAGLIGSGLTYGGFGRPDADFKKTPAIFVSGGALFALGLPLLVIGAAPEDEAERRAEKRVKARKKKVRTEPVARERERVCADLEQRLAAGERIPTRMHSPTMVGFGVGSLVLFGAGGIASSAAAAGVQGGGAFDFSGIERAFYIGGAALCFGHAAGLGIPLTAIGAKQRVVMPDELEVRGAPKPRVSLGAGTITADFTF
jgi:hypothetical protein